MLKGLYVVLEIEPVLASALPLTMSLLSLRCNSSYPCPYYYIYQTVIAAEMSWPDMVTWTVLALRTQTPR